MTFSSRLSVSGLENGSISHLPFDFVFIVGKLKYKCSSLVAALAAPIIGRDRGNDATRLRYKVRTPDDDGYFSDFLAFGYGRDVVVTSKSERFLTAIAIEVENWDLLELSLEHRAVGTARELADTVRLKERYNIDAEKEIDLLAKMFVDVADDDVLGMSFDALKKILCSDVLVIKDEDCLVDLIVRLTRVDYAYYMMFEYVRFQYVSQASFSKFLDATRDPTFPMSGGLWMTISERLMADVKVVPDEVQKHRVLVLDPPITRVDEPEPEPEPELNQNLEAAMILRARHQTFGHFG